MLVSIMMITYHHEAFVAQAIDSILMQEVNFPIEIVVGDEVLYRVVEREGTHPQEVEVLARRLQPGIRFVHRRRGRAEINHPIARRLLGIGDQRPRC